jgi:hypothetical protein
MNLLSKKHFIHSRQNAKVIKQMPKFKRKDPGQQSLFASIDPKTSAQPSCQSLGRVKTHQRRGNRRQWIP